MKRIRAIFSRIIAMAVVLATSSAALAQEFQKVDETKKLVDNVPAVPFVGIAYGVIWLAVLIYVASVARGLARVNSDMEELRKKLDAAGATRK
jgi:CcmD family protein